MLAVARPAFDQVPPYGRAEAEMKAAKLLRRAASSVQRSIITLAEVAEHACQDRVCCAQGNF
jgi:hypothetical protein